LATRISMRNAAPQPGMQYVLVSALTEIGTYTGFQCAFCASDPEKFRNSSIRQM